jgi:hypothetical protein
MALAKFMAQPIGRGIRILLGLAIIAFGLMTGGTVGIVLAVVGVLPIAMGVFNMCLIAPILGVPFSGKAVLEQ